MTVEKTGKDLLELTHARGFFTIDDKYPGVIMMDSQGWVFDRGNINPRPITRTEILHRGGVPALADEAAELLTADEWQWLESLTEDEDAKKNDFLNSIPLTKTEMNEDDSQTKEKAT